MQQPRTGLPIFLENTPKVVCEQILFLIKNSDLNFQLKETPFSLDISLKKRFVNHWNQSSQNHQSQNFVYPGSPQNETIFHPSAPHQNFQEIHTQNSSNLQENSDLLK